MNAAGDHSMGSTIPTDDPAADQAGTASGRLQASAAALPPGVEGLDVSAWQTLTAASWSQIYANGARFVYVKATEGTDYVSSQFSEQYNDSYNAGLIHGAYHFATPNTSSGAAQADYFLAHGGTPTGDGRTLPPLLDIEYNPYGATCYGLSQSAMVSWISSFVNTVYNTIGRWPAIYSTTDWWTQCTGNSAAFSADPLFIARYPSSISEGAGTLPAGWSTYTMWQYADSGTFPGDQDVFNGSLASLQALGLGSSLVRTVSNASVYLISGTSKYPVTNMTIYGALAPLGAVAYVSQSFLDDFTTGAAVSRFLASPSGTIYFYDSGIKLAFGSCAQLADYGGSCNTGGYVPVTTSQIASFVTGPNMTSLMSSAGGPRYYVDAGAKHEILSTAAQTAADVTGAANVLSATALSYLPFGAPIVTSGVYAAESGTSSYFLLSGGDKYAVDPSADAVAGLPAKEAGSLQAGSLALIPNGSSTFTGVMQTTGSSTVDVLGSGGAYTWASGVGGDPFTPLSVPATFAAMYPAAGAIQPGTAIMSTASATVYLVMPTDILPVGAWDSLVALSGGKTPTIVTVPQAVIASLPKGPIALTAGTLVRSPENATVYLINGVTNKIALSSFIYTQEAGITTFSYTTQARLDAYPTSSTLLGFGLQCGTQQYVSAGGSIHPVSSTLSPLYPFTYVSLDSFTCALLTKGAAATEFIRTASNGRIYYLKGGKKEPILTMARYQQLSDGQGYLNVADQFAAAIPTGPDA